MQDSNGGMKSSAVEIKTSYLFMNRRNQFHVVYGFDGGGGGGVSDDDVLIAIRRECANIYFRYQTLSRTLTSRLCSGPWMLFTYITLHHPTTKPIHLPSLHPQNVNERNGKSEKCQTDVSEMENQRRLPFACLQWNVMLMPSAGDSAEIGTTVGGYSITVLYCALLCKKNKWSKEEYGLSQLTDSHLDLVDRLLTTSR